MNQDIWKCGRFGDKRPRKWHDMVSFMNKRAYFEVNDHDLLNLTFLAAKKEKEATLALLEYLLEVECRRLYATKAYSSLFEYIVKDLGLSEPAAAERVNAVRLDLLLLKEQKRHGQVPKFTRPAESKYKKSTHSDSRFVSIDLKREIFKRSGGQCEYTDPKTKKRCECKYRIQIDHLYPYALGGKTELQNLRHLCVTHNLHAAKRWGLTKPVEAYCPSQSY